MTCSARQLVGGNLQVHEVGEGLALSERWALSGRMLDRVDAAKITKARGCSEQN